MSNNVNFMSIILFLNFLKINYNINKNIISLKYYFLIN